MATSNVWLSLFRYDKLYDLQAANLPLCGSLPSGLSELLDLVQRATQSSGTLVLYDTLVLYESRLEFLLGFDCRLDVGLW